MSRALASLLSGAKGPSVQKSLFLAMAVRWPPSPPDVRELREVREGARARAWNAPGLLKSTAELLAKQPLLGRAGTSEPANVRQGLSNIALTLQRAPGAPRL